MITIPKTSESYNKPEGLPVNLSPIKFAVGYRRNLDEIGMSYGPFDDLAMAMAIEPEVKDDPAVIVMFDELNNDHVVMEWPVGGTMWTRHPALPDDWMPYALFQEGNRVVGSTEISGLWKIADKIIGQLTAVRDRDWFTIAPCTYEVGNRVLIHDPIMEYDRITSKWVHIIK